MSIRRMGSGLLLAASVLAGCTSAPGPAPPQPAAAGTVTADDIADIPDCDVGALTGEAREVIDDVETGGPFEYPRNDGVTFENREGLLPDEDPDYYREFTVETPGLNNRGARRIVTGGPDERHPERWYYTDDHYESFCEFTPPG